MQATEERTTTAHATTPSWVWAVLVFGAAVMLTWAWFIIGFRSEPSAIGRIWIVLVTSAACSAGSALVGVIGAIGLIRRERWARTVAGIAAAAMTLTVVGAVAGIPALIGLLSSRNTTRP
ncbi:MAG TPA: hypothetical protein VIJ58_13195 [Candidatus Dormibacteraeota bacterium]